MRSVSCKNLPKASLGPASTFVSRPSLKSVIKWWTIVDLSLGPWAGFRVTRLDCKVNGDLLSFILLNWGFIRIYELTSEERKSFWWENQKESDALDGLTWTKLGLSRSNDSNMGSFKRFMCSFSHMYVVSLDFIHSSPKGPNPYSNTYSRFNIKETSE